MSHRTYTDEQLAVAVAASRSWRGVLRELGLTATSAGSARSVRRHCDRLGVSYAHFSGQRRWSDSQLRAAVDAAGSWLEVARLLGLAAGGGTLAALRAHALRLGLTTDHFALHDAPRPSSQLLAERGDPKFVRDAGSLFAATWFALRGVGVSWPLEPCRYDLAADVDGTLHRIQVKTTAHSGGDAIVTVSNSRRTGRAVYGPNEIDWYFVLDGELTAYLIPYEVVAGYGYLKMSHYAAFKVAENGELLSGVSSPAPGPRSRSGCR